MSRRIIDIAFGRYTYSDTGIININVGFRPKMIDFLALFHLGDFNEHAVSPANEYEDPIGRHTVPISKGAATDNGQIVQSTNVVSDSMNSHITYTGDGYVVYQVFLQNRGEDRLGANRITFKDMTSVGFELEVIECFNPNSFIYRAFR